jgi:hypothetical protein
MEKYQYSEFVDRLRRALNSCDCIEFKCDYYNYFNWNGFLEIKMGEFSNEEIGSLFPILHSWLEWDFYQYMREIKSIHNTVYGRIILIQKELFISVGFEGPYDEEFSDFCCRFNFDKIFFLETLGMKNDNFVRNLLSFDIKNIFVFCHIENYRVGDLSHIFDFDIYYQDSNNIKNTFQLNDHQKQLARNFILKDILKDSLPTLDIYTDCIQTYDSIYIEGDIDDNYVSIGNITSSEHLISFDEIRNSLVSENINSFV